MMMDLQRFYKRLCEDHDPIRGAMRDAETMRVYADGDETFNLGDWKAWRSACHREGRAIPPAEFKSLTKKERMAHL